MSVNDASIHKACGAATSGDTASVIKCLECPPVAVSTGLDEPLVVSTHKSAKLMQLLTKENEPNAFRALLMVPHCYETPWRTVLSMVELCHASEVGGDRRALSMTVTEIQGFLQQTTASWWKLERQRTSSLKASSLNRAPSTTTPRHLLQELANLCLRPLLVTENDADEVVSATRDNQHWTQPLELVTSIISNLSDLDNRSESITCYVLDRLCQGRIRCERLLPWLTLVSDVRPHLRDCDWTRTHEVLLQAVQSNLIPACDMPGLVRAIASFLSDASDDIKWEMIILQLLFASSQDASTYSTAEIVLKSSLASLATPTLRRCLDNIQNANEGVPKWVVANMTLLLLQAIQQSGSQMVSSLVEEALGRRGESAGSGLLQQCWASLVQLAFPSVDKESPTRRGRRKRISHVESINNVMKYLSYRGNGRFERKGEVDNGANLSTEIVCQSILLGNETLSEGSHHVFSSERAQLWVDAADTVLRPRIDAMNKSGFNDILFAILIVVTVYYEVPASRSTIVRTIIQCLTGNETKSTLDELQTYHCVLITTIVRSMTKESRSERAIVELNALASISGQSLTKHVFQDLTTALSPLPSARTAILSVSRKYLNSSFGGNLWWGVGALSQGMKENRDRVDCALHGLCTLLVSEDQVSWDDCGVDAWVMLSQIIVQNQPALPMSDRSYLFQRLRWFIEHQQFSMKAIEHLLRVCLVRLLQYFEGDREQTLRFVPERVFTSWRSRDPSKENRSCTSPREDFVGLVRLVMVLLENQYASHDDPRLDSDGFQIFSDCREYILRLLSEDDSSNDDLECVLTSNESLCSSVACACLVAALKAAITTDSPVHQAHRSAGRDSSFEAELRQKLETNEIAASSSKTRSSNPEGLCLWTNRRSNGSIHVPTNRSSAADTPETRRLLSSICDIVFDLMFHKLWSMNADDSIEGKQRLVDSVSSLVRAKRSLQNREGEGIHFSDGRLPLVLFDGATLCTSAPPFIGMCSDVAKSLISRHADLDVTLGLLESILLLCSSSQQLASDQGARAFGTTDKCRIIRQLWNAYRAIGSDDASRCLLTYLEAKSYSRRDATKYSFLTNTAAGDVHVDALVRRVRLIPLWALDAWLQSLVNSNESWNDSSSISSQSDLPNNRIPATFWLNCARATIADIKSGLTGRSGGMTEDLYTTFLSVLENSYKMTLTATQDEKDKVHFLLSLSRSISESCAILSGVMCCFLLKHAAPFKKTLLLSSSVLPSIRRKSIIFLLACGKGCDDGSGEDFAINVFYQMMDVTLRQHRLGLSDCAAWSEIVGPAHITVAEDKNGDKSENQPEEKETSSEQGASDEIPSFVVIPADDHDGFITDDADLDSRTKKVLLPSKDSWSWASGCVLVAMEKLWMESFSILQGSMDIGCGSAPPDVELFAAYSLAHAKDLSNILRAVRHSMKSFEELKEVMSNGKAISISSAEQLKKDVSAPLAVLFPEAIKLRLCVLVERVALVLQLALRSMLSQLKRGGDDGLLIRAESLSFLCAWVRSQPEELGLGLLCRRWLLAEKQIQDKSQGVQSSSASISRLTRVCLRMQGLEDELRKVLHAMERIEKIGTPGALKVVNDFEALLDAQCNDELLRRNRTSLKTMIQLQLMSCARDRPDSLSLSYANGYKSKRKASREDQDPRMRKRRRDVPRSRNHIVDKWLSIDDGFDEAADDDAYVDLEDFLVDG